MASVTIALLTIAMSTAANVGTIVVIVATGVEVIALLCLVVYQNLRMAPTRRGFELLVAVYEGELAR